MKHIALLLCMSASLFAQAPPQPKPMDPSAPSITLDEKIALMTDDVKQSDILEAAQKSYLEKMKPIKDHQDATRAVIEKEHPGYTVEPGPQGWHLVKKPEPKPEAKAVTPAPKK